MGGVRERRGRNEREGGEGEGRERVERDGLREGEMRGREGGRVG